MLRAIRMCLRHIAANADNILRLLVSVGCASGTNSGISSLLLLQCYCLSTPHTTPLLGCDGPFCEIKCSPKINVHNCVGFIVCKLLIEEQRMLKWLGKANFTPYKIAR